MFKALTAILIAALINTPAFAASDDAWSEFAAKVEQSCLAATNDMLTDTAAVVDPFGSESYGLAIVSGTAADRKQAAILCVFDKKTEVVEVGGELSVAIEPNR